MGREFPESVFQVAGREAYVYGLLAETVPPAVNPAGAQPSEPITPSQAQARLKETPTLVVRPQVLEALGATDFPFLIVCDPRGIVRVAQPVDESALAPGGTVDSAIALVGSRWAIPKPAKEAKIAGSEPSSKPSR